MGVFSWKCCVCKKPILNSMITDRSSRCLSDAVVITPEGSVEGGYDGYGRIETCEEAHEFYEGGENVKLLHQNCFKGQAYEDLKFSENDEKQGHFYSDSEINLYAKEVRNAGR